MVHKHFKGIFTETKIRLVPVSTCKVRLHNSLARTANYMNSVIRQLREGYHRFGSLHYLKHLSFSSQVLLLVNVNAQTINYIFDSALFNELSRVATL